MNIQTLRKRYPCFLYKGYSWKHEKGDLEIDYNTITENKDNYSDGFGNVAGSKTAKENADKIGKILKIKRFFS